jgi:hypothetical protein
MNENEEHLEDFYRIWSEQGAQVIVQKYDSYAGFLPERQPADLSPLNRFRCWHLKRICRFSSTVLCRSARMILADENLWAMRLTNNLKMSGPPGRSSSLLIPPVSIPESARAVMSSIRSISDAGSLHRRRRRYHGSGTKGRFGSVHRPA